MFQRYCRNVIVCAIFLALIVVPLLAVAQQGEHEIPLLLSTGLPAGDRPEKFLPAGAIGYLRANNVQVLLENIDSLFTSFIPEKALPPEFQPFLANPQPFIAFLSAQAFGQPVASGELSNLLGVGFDRPVGLALYPMPQGFVLSVPIAHPTVITGVIRGMLRPKSVEKGTIGDIGYYRVASANRQFPPELYILTSDSNAYICGNFELAQMLANSVNMGTIGADPVVATAVKKYADRDLTLVVSPGMLKAQLPFFKQMASQALIPVFFQIRAGVQRIPPAPRMMFDARLRLEFGIDNVDQLVDYGEAYASGLYTVLLNEIVELLTDLDGLALSVNIEEQYQNVALTFFSQAVQSEKFTNPLPLDAIKQALNALPGDKSPIFALGQVPEASSSKLLTSILDAIEKELTNKGLPQGAISVFKEYHLAKQQYSCLESKVKWTLKTLIARSETIDFSQFNTLWELLKYTQNRMFGGPSLVSLTLMPSVAEGVIENYFAGKADMSNKNAQLHQNMHQKLSQRPAFFEHSSRFFQENAGAGLKKLIFENVHTTRLGFFGYQQHELVNRRIIFHKKQAEYDVLYNAGAETARLAALLDVTSHPVPQALIKLLDQAPSGTTGVHLCRVLYLVSNLLDLVGGVEGVIHRDIDTFLLKTQEIVDTHGEDAFEAKLLEAKINLPLLMTSLHLDENGKVYAMLPGFLHYPRPKTIPKVKELFADFLKAASDIGGNAVFMAVQAGEFEISTVQSTEALALLVKTVVNNAYGKYMASPEGMELLQRELVHPKDFQDFPEEVIFEHPMWKAIMEGGEFGPLAAIQRSKQARTKADMMAIGTALGSYQVALNAFPAQEFAVDLRDSGLPQDYYRGTYVDGWKRPYIYISDPAGSQYLLISYGKDGMPGVTQSQFDEDLVYMNGQFLTPEGDFWDGDRDEMLNTALIQAVNEHARDFVEVLLNVGVDPNAVADEGQNALSLANELGYDDIAELLKDFGAIEYVPAK